MKIAVVTDSCLAMTQKEAEENGIVLLPLQLICEDGTYLDGVNITIPEVNDRLSKGEMPSTSCPPIGLVEEAFQKLKDEGYEAIICIPITRGLSATAENFEMAAKQLEMKIETIDLYTTCNLQYYVTMRCKELVDEGLELEEVVGRLRKAVENSNTLIIPNDLGHLKRGGRLTPMAAALGSLLKIKPILRLNKDSEGKIDVFEKVRTANKAYTVAIERLKEKQDPSKEYIWTVIYSQDEMLAKEVEQMILSTQGNAEILTREMPPVISAHTGLRCIGIQYIERI